MQPIINTNELCSNIQKFTEKLFHFDKLFSDYVKTENTNLDIIKDKIEVTCSAIQFSKDIYIKPINSFLAEGELLGKKVIMMHEIGYINATKLCKEIGNSSFKNWNKDHKKDEFIGYVLKRITQEAFGNENSAQNLPAPNGASASLDYNSLKLEPNDTKNINLNSGSHIIPAQNLPVQKQTGAEQGYNSLNIKQKITYLMNNSPVCKEDLIIYYDGSIETRGQYVHPYLIIDIAQWCNKEFAFLITHIAMDFINKEATRKKEDMIKQLSLKNKEYETKNKSLEQLVAKLNNKIDINTQQNNHLISQVEITNQQNAYLISQMDIANQQIKEGNLDLAEIKTDIRSAKAMITDKYVPEPIYDDQNEVCILIRNRNYSYSYTMLRVMLKCKNLRLKEHNTLIKKYDEQCSYEIKREINTANAKNLWNRIKDKLINKSYNDGNIDNIHFNLKMEYNYNNLEQIISEVESEKQDIVLFKKYN